MMMRKLRLFSIQVVGVTLLLREIWRRPLGGGLERASQVSQGVYHLGSELNIMGKGGALYLVFVISADS